MNATNSTQRSPNTYYTTNYHYTFVPNKEDEGHKMHGSRRVIAFCLLTTVLPTILIVIPLYLRNIRYADVMYRISDSDIIQIHKGQSSIFCEKHSLKMNTTFNAFQMKGRPELSEKRKHVRLKKSMTLPDDTLEYWGFYLFKGATVELKACSRYEGSKILVVKGDRILNTCGILEGDKYRKDPPLVINQGHVVVTIEDPDEAGENNSTEPLLLDNRSIEGEHTSMEDNNNMEYENVLNTQNHSTNTVNTTEYMLHVNLSSDTLPKRHKRENSGHTLHNPNTILDAGVNHGGNAMNSTIKTLQDSSVSSFENSLYDCYHDNMLLNNYFPFAIHCNSTKYLEKTKTLKVIHDVLQDGYYYYIFYSDNDIVRNDIHVIFDIYKPTFQYVNMSDAKVCVNRTECEFDVGFLSDELVIVEVPTKDGLKNDDNISILISVCQPRMSIYIFFPIAVLLFVLLFAFL